MHRSTVAAVLLAIFVHVAAASARAQTPPKPAPPSPPQAQAPQSEIGGCKVSQMQGATQEMMSKEFEGKTERVTVLTGSGALPVKVDCDETQFFGDFIELYLDRNRVVATGNVTVVSDTSRISADRLEFDTKTKTGVFYEAHGWASLGDRAERSMFGTQEPDAQFRGREIHKLGPKKYRIVDGAFSSCAQPTPRWEIVSGSATLNLDDYVLLKNSVLRVKNVPLMYMPIFYYPLEEDDRSTGFLIPVYGTSTLNGQAWTFPFFWAISRSQDATLEYSWMSKGGSVTGGEYRYVLAPGSQGNLQTAFTNEKANGDVASDGGRSYRIDGGMSQNLGHGWRAQARADYFSSATAQQRFQQDVYRATQSQRSFGANLSGAWHGYSMSSTFDRTDFFSIIPGNDSITTSGSLPRVNFSRGERPIGKTPIYFGLGSEFVTLLRSTSSGGDTTSDQGLSRFEFAPSVRVPFSRWPFFTINSAVSWHGTYWTESIANREQVPEALRRQYFDFNARFVGPTFTRIFNTPGSDYAQKFKHVIEPSFAIQRIAGFDFDTYNRIVQLEGPDYVVPDTFRVSYALTTRLYAKKEISREILSAAVTQSHYNDARAAQVDQQYQNSFTTRQASKFTPVALTVRGAPTDRVTADFRTEWDPTSHAFLSFAGVGTVNSKHVQASAGWSQQRIVANTPGAVPIVASHFLNSTVNIRTANNHLGGTYAFNYDLHNTAFLQQRYFAYYNAQCCGVLVEYQSFTTGLAGLPENRRFNVSFTLAGIGTASNLLGVFGGGAGR
jgi:LPS-assembly protein